MTEQTWDMICSLVERLMVFLFLLRYCLSGISY